MIGIRIRYFTGCPSRVAGLNFQALAAATSMRSWKRRCGEIRLTAATSPFSSTTISKMPVSSPGAGFFGSWGLTRTGALTSGSSLEKTSSAAGTAEVAPRAPDGGAGAAAEVSLPPAGAPATAEAPLSGL